MIKKYALIIGIFLLNYNICISQINKQHCDNYLLVLDIQDTFYKNTPLDSLAKKMILTVNSLVSNFAPEKVIYVKSTGKILSISSKGFSIDTMPVPGFDSRLNVVSDNIFIKLSGDAFTSSGLRNYLENKKAKEIIIVGLLAEKCIYHTALGGKKKGYDIYIIPEAIIGKTTKKKEKAIKKITRKGIKLLPIKEII